MKKQAQKDTTPKKEDVTVDVDPVEDFNKNCKNHLDNKTPAQNVTLESINTAGLINVRHSENISQGK